MSDGPACEAETEVTGSSRSHRTERSNVLDGIDWGRGRERHGGPPLQLDTVGIAVPIHATFDTEGCSVSARMVDGALNNFRFRRELAGGGFAAMGVGDKVWLEASLPKRADPDGSNVEALDLGAALVELERMHSEVEEFATFDRDRDGHVFEAAKVVRLDLVRDFVGVKSGAELLDGLAGVRQAGRVKVRRFADGERGNAETLRVGPGAWASTLYDKHAEVMGSRPSRPADRSEAATAGWRSSVAGWESRSADLAGRLRFEARLHSDQLRSVGAREHGGCVGTVGDVVDREGALCELRRWMFKRVGFDRKVSGVNVVIAEVFGSNGLSKREKRELWAYLTARPFGVDLGYSRTTIAKYERMAAQLGITLAKPRELDDTFAVELDYDEGRQILSAA